MKYIDRLKNPLIMWCFLIRLSAQVSENLLTMIVPNFMCEIPNLLFIYHE